MPEVTSEECTICAFLFTRGRAKAIDLRGHALDHLVELELVSISYADVMLTDAGMIQTSRQRKWRYVIECKLPKENFWKAYDSTVERSQAEAIIACRAPQEQYAGWEFRLTDVNDIFEPIRAEIDEFRRQRGYEPIP